jgi:hypothetical protein
LVVGEDEDAFTVIDIVEPFTHIDVAFGRLVDTGSRPKVEVIKFSLIGLDFLVLLLLDTC